MAFLLGVLLGSVPPGSVAAVDDESAVASVADEERPTATWDGFGPLAVRNFQPIQLIFLNLPFKRARALECGAFTLRVQLAESNVIATDADGIDALLKFETNRTVFGASLGIGSGVDISLDVPFLSRFGGFMDPVIDAVEDFFGAQNPERSLFPDNTFGGFWVRRGDVTLFNGTEQTFELGDIWLEGKKEVWRAASFPLLAAVRTGVKLPTGRPSNVWGSGKPDFALGVAADYRALDWMMLYGNVTGVFPVGPITDGNLRLDPFVNEGLAFEVRLADWLSFLFQQELYSSPIHGTGSSVLDGTVIELTAGFNAAWGPVLFQLGGINNVSGVAQAADFTLIGQLSYRGQLGF
jgi:hypothetical protein